MFKDAGDRHLFVVQAGNAAIALIVLIDLIPLGFEGRKIVGAEDQLAIDNLKAGNIEGLRYDPFGFAGFLADQI